MQRLRQAAPACVRSTAVTLPCKKLPASIAPALRSLQAGACSRGVVYMVAAKRPAGVPARRISRGRARLRERVGPPVYRSGGRFVAAGRQLASGIGTLLADRQRPGRVASLMKHCRAGEGTPPSCLQARSARAGYRPCREGFATFEPSPQNAKCTLTSGRIGAQNCRSLKEQYRYAETYRKALSTSIYIQ